MAITLNPIGIAVKQPLVCCRGFCVEAAIAEKPGTAMCDRLVVAGKSEGPPSTFERVVAATLMKQDFSKIAVQSRRIWVVPVILSQSAQTVVERAVFHGAGEGRTIDR